MHKKCVIVIKFIELCPIILDSIFIIFFQVSNKTNFVIYMWLHYFHIWVCSIIFSSS